MTSPRPEDVLITLLRSAYRNARHGAPSIRTIPSSASRQLSCLAAAAPGTTLNPSVTRYLNRSRIQKLPQALIRTFATAQTSNDGRPPREIAVLGGGITGLTTAHYLARHAKDAHITLYEGSKRLGGWVDGKLATVGDGPHDKVLFQRGPRMLRAGTGSWKYDDLIFYDVLANLNLGDKIRPHRVSMDRYMYYPDHLVRLPSSALTLDNIFHTIRSFLTEPIWDGVFKGLWHSQRKTLRQQQQQQDEPVVVSNRREQLAQDQSVAEFVKGIFGSDRVVGNLVSGMMHGIYGGDAYKLSARHTIFDSYWRRTNLAGPADRVWADAKDAVLLEDLLLGGPNRTAVGLLAQRAVRERWNILAFDDGLLTLSNALVRDLQAQGNVTIKTDCRVAELAYKEDGVLVTSANEPEAPKKYDQVISTLFSKQLSELVRPKNLLPALADTHAVSIMVVNLFFPNPDLLAGNHGFGYLVPTATPGNDEAVLGVLFDSDLQTRDEIPGTKLTVMLGGHHWDGWAHLPSEEMGKEMALQAVQRHLRIPASEKVFGSARLCRDCLPQHYVGHRRRMSAAHYELLAAFQGRLSVAGPSYTTIGVVPSMRAGYDVAMRVATGHGAPYFRKFDAAKPDWDSLGIDGNIVDHVGATGLEGFTEDEFGSLVSMQRGSMPFRTWSDPEVRA
ncbi:hypothetical protein M426DRAFT_24813 [Hypoxylon sp. CI-4A]|nr:hypothetical protein M426DRAFT_24813 [Hypoxylon sp. CI-4A]